MARTFIPNCNVVSVYMQRQFCCAWYKLKPNPCRDTPNHISHMTKTSHGGERAAKGRSNMVRRACMFTDDVLAPKTALGMLRHLRES